MAASENNTDSIVFKCVYSGGTDDQVEFREEGSELGVCTKDYQDVDADGDPTECHMYIAMDDIPELIVWLGARYKSYKED